MEINSNHMKILVINYEYPPIGGGGGFVTRDILEQIVRLGHHVSVVTSHFRGLKKYELVNGVELFRVPVLFRTKKEVANMPSLLSYFPSSLIHAVVKLQSRKYDVINTHFAIPSGPAGYLLSKLFKVPNVLSLHGGDIFDPSKSLSPHRTPLLRNVVKFNLNRADGVVAQSNDTKLNACKYYDVARSIEVIPLGIKKPVFAKKTRRDFHLDSDAMVFCTIGRLIKRKNLDDALEVLSEIKAEYKFKLLVIGEGPERAHLETLQKQYGLEEAIMFFGNVSDEVKFQLLDLSDFYLSTALHEGFGLVFLEAMECGLPVICYNRGGQNDFLVDGKTGFLIEVANKRAFYKKTIELIRNKRLRDDMSYYNKRVINSYYINNCADKYVSLFETVISQASCYLDVPSGTGNEARP